MRKHYFPIVITALVLVASCSKSTPTTNPNPNPGGGGGGGGTTTGMTVSSISPANPYPDDEFVINGTGFNPDKTKDTVQFGRLINGNFGAWQGGLAAEWPSLCTIISASSTQLRVKANNPIELDDASFSMINNPNSISVAQIKSGGKKVVTPLIAFKRIMRLNGTNDPEAHISWGRPGDSLEIFGTGFNKSGVQVSIGQTALNILNIDSSAGSSTIRLRMPKDFFGNSNDEAATDIRTLTVTNADGKSLHKDITFFMSPTMKIFSMSPEQSSYSKGSGGVIRINITGRHLKNTAVVHLDSGNGTHTQFPLPVTGFPSTCTLELTTPSMAVGNYQVTIYFGPYDALYGLCNFVLTN